ncbi:MAG: DM13 domain-containing protein [Thermoproteota archaeon]|nr:DM13 domain-containing protein [Thermoproteota archaeon]
MKGIRGIILGVMIVSSIATSVILVSSKSQISFAVSPDIQTFMNMTEEQRVQEANNMTQEQKQAVMDKFSRQNSTVNENMSATMTNNSNSLMGNFVGAGDGFHNVEGVAKVLTLSDGKTFLRLENLKATNGPDLYIYLSTSKDASDIVNLGRLKGNIGNQNYEIPAETDLSKYNTVLVWCKAFSTLFGSAKLSSQ